VNDLKKRDSIVKSGNKITWTLTWSDLERFDELNEDDRKDKLAFSPAYLNTIKTLQKIPYWTAYSSELTKSNNSLERLIWMLLNPINEHNREKKIALCLATLQKEFAKPSCNESDLNNCLSQHGKIESSTMATNLKDGAFYVFPDVQVDFENFITIKTAVRVSDLEVSSKTYVSPQITSIEKDHWEIFWQIYNLIQFNTDINFEVNEQELVAQNKYDCLVYHNPQLHDIIKQLIDNNIEFERDGGFILTTNDGFAEAMLGFNDPKIAILPLSEEDEMVFKREGYQILSPEMFNINMIRK
jgi:hypothetical protein